VRICLVLLLGLLACGCGRTKSTSELTADLKAGDEKERITAVRTLPHRTADASQVIPALIAALKDRDGDIRHDAAMGLGPLRDQAREALPALRAAQHDRDARVRKAAGVALSRIDPQAARQAIR